MFKDVKLTSWREAVDALDYLAAYGGRRCLFRGHASDEWQLRTSLEREFGKLASWVENRVMWRFIRTAGPMLPSYMRLDDNDAADWLGLIQHYGGPTRLLDVTRSPYVALFFAFESLGEANRVVWVIDGIWCIEECAKIMAANEGTHYEVMLDRLFGLEKGIVSSLVHGIPYRHPLFKTFQGFNGVFPIDPWKPDSRQSAQQALFLCTANTELTFSENLAAHKREEGTLYRFVLPSNLRLEVLDRLSMMNVTAATLFPDLNGLARSLRTHTVERDKPSAVPPWE